MNTHIPALVAGGGISGLVCAYALRRAGIDAQVVECSPHSGGMIRSERRENYLLEFGPQSFNATASVLNLCRELRIEDQLVQAPAQAPRFVLVDGRLRVVPLSPPSFFASSLFGARTKFRVLSDLLGNSSPPENDESIATFVRRKFSPELLEKLVGPFVSGIYAGDPEKLSLRSAFPQLYEAEKSAGSVIRGLRRTSRKSAARGERPTLQSFRKGNQTLIDALAASLGSSLRCNVEARSVRRAARSNGGASGFEVTLVANNMEDKVFTDRLIVATPVPQAAAMLRELDPQFETALQQVEYAPIAVVSLGYQKSAIRHALAGFGFLAPRSSGLRVLGSVWNSSLFAGRAPEGQALLTSFVGGATDPDAMQAPESQLIATVHSELTAILGISRPPIFSNVWKLPRAIPQYNIGHTGQMNRLNGLQTKHPHVHLTGNYLRGPALGTCIEQALTAAQEAGKQ
ncbi:MAG TPA: protoporphyrinogen oxidase [Candidatus Acidoferrum sp.]